MSNLDTGRVRVRLACDRDRVSAVQVSSERPDAAVFLRGRNADQAVRLLPLLFALCGQAQARAAELALAAAQGEECAARLNTGVQCEMLREHLWRCLLDLPPLLGETAMQQEFVSAAKWVAAEKRGELRTLLTGPRITRLRQLLMQASEPTCPAHRLLPTLDAKSSLAEWPRLNAGFCRLPNWRGMAAETGAIARRMPENEAAASPWSARWLARLDELLDWSAGNEKVGAGGTVSAAPVAPGTGRALVETARGLLMHEIVLDGERVADYMIVAPTEWNFHPRGMLHDCLPGSDARDRDVLERHVARLVVTLDPCVPWELEWA
ncbi:MAG: nickel-dependent hydrogenase large subunit [Nitrosomonadales bacterium]|nr:nickel-dependent hydrogenase large subunit [Nitrosomonadales bacterium]